MLIKILNKLLHLISFVFVSVHQYKQNNVPKHFYDKTVIKIKS